MECEECAGEGVLAGGTGDAGVGASVNGGWWVVLLAWCLRSSIGVLIGVCLALALVLLPSVGSPTTLSDFLNQHFPLLFPSPTPQRPQVRNLGYTLVSNANNIPPTFSRFSPRVLLQPFTHPAMFNLRHTFCLTTRHTSLTLPPRPPWTFSPTCPKIQGVLAPFEAEMAWIGACMAGADGWVNICVGLVPASSGGGGGGGATPRRR